MSEKGNKYDYLLNLNKEKVIELLGHEFNFYPANTWTYVLEIKRLYRKTVMFIFFENEKVSTIEIKKIYGKISTKL
ncbi:hypothetical protein [Chryseobacterium sp. SIMBA_029]|uniref:hypothetical protein n=1 Tax=Chryseobacterium sp. SIMBA_029 TaxID=3085772 RepID=UPI00397ACFB3